MKKGEDRKQSVLYTVIDKSNFIETNSRLYTVSYS